MSFMKQQVGRCLTKISHIRLIMPPIAKANSNQLSTIRSDETDSEVFRCAFLLSTALFLRRNKKEVNHCVSRSRTESTDRCWMMMVKV